LKLRTLESALQSDLKDLNIKNHVCKAEERYISVWPQTRVRAKLRVLHEKGINSLPSTKCTLTAKIVSKINNTKGI